MNENLKFKIENLIPVFSIIWLLSIPFSFAWEPDFWESLKSRTSLPLWNVYTADFTTLFFLLASAIYLFWHKKFVLALKTKLFAEGLLLVSLAPLSALWSGSPALSFLWGARLLAYCLVIFFALYLMSNSSQLKNLFLKTVVFVGAIESVIVTVQFIFQHSIGLWFLGEGLISQSIPGLAKTWIGSWHLVRAYGTFPHPNILGGFLLFTLTTTFCYGTERYKNFWLALQILALGLTFSRSAILGLFLLIFLNRQLIFTKSLNKKFIFFFSLLALLSLFFLFRSPIQNILSGHDSATRLRFEYAKAAYERFIDSPILGRGWATEPTELPAFSHFPFYFWEYQPVHNIYLLVLSDLGITGLLIFLYFIYKVLSGPSKAGMSLFIAYLFIGLFDHYLLTLPQGIAIFFLSAALSFLPKAAPESA